MYHLIEWDETNHYIIIKNSYSMDIIHQKSDCFIDNHYIYVGQDHIVINDIKEAQSSYSINQDISLVDSIIYDSTIYHIRICDSFGTIMVDDIDLSSMTREHSISGFIDFMKHPSENIVVIFNNHIFKKNDLNIKVDTSTTNILEFTFANLNINLTQSLSSIIQRFSNITSYLIFIEFVISLQIQDFIQNQLVHPGRQLHLNIIQYDNLSMSIIHNTDFHIEHIIHHLESYITFHLWIYLTYNITVDISYLNQFIFEFYNTIIETNVIRNVDLNETSYIYIKIPDPYIITGDILTLAYHNLSLPHHQPCRAHRLDSGDQNHHCCRRRSRHQDHQGIA